MKKFILTISKFVLKIPLRIRYLIIFCLLPLIFILFIRVGNYIFINTGFNINPANIDNRDWLAFFGIYITFWVTFWVGSIANNISSQSQEINNQILNLSKRTYELEKQKTKPILRVDKVSFTLQNFDEFSGIENEQGLFTFYIVPSNCLETITKYKLFNLDLTVLNISQNEILELTSKFFHLKLVGSTIRINSEFKLYMGPVTTYYQDGIPIRLVVLLPNDQVYSSVFEYLSTNNAFLLESDIEIRVKNINGDWFLNSFNFVLQIIDYHVNQQKFIEKQDITYY